MVGNQAGCLFLLVPTLIPGVTDVTSTNPSVMRQMSTEHLVTRLCT